MSDAKEEGTVEQAQPIAIEPIQEAAPVGTIRMSDADIRTGILLELEAARAQARLQTLLDSGEQLKSVLFTKYELSPDQYQLNDWLEGFVPITNDQAPMLQPSAKLTAS